jgi:LPXTG-site transpeptidase (sortase) family protein
MSQYQPNNSKQSFLDLVWQYKFYLLFYVFGISFLSFTALYLVGGVPVELRVLDEQPVAKPVDPALLSTSTTIPLATTTVVTNPKPSSSSDPLYAMGTDFPLRVIIDKVNIDTSISNPTSADISILNNALLKGAVRYPGSGTLGHGNMFIFGHSTGIRVVNNQAYKAFNNLKDVEIGDTIRIQSIDKEYNYKVTSVSMVDSEEAWVTFSQDKNMVTLSTCNVFGQKQDRYVVEAIFVKSIDLQ